MVGGSVHPLRGRLIMFIMAYTKVLVCLTVMLMKSTLATADEEYPGSPDAYCPDRESCCERFGLNKYSQPEVAITASSESTASGGNHGPDRAALFQVYVANQGRGAWCTSTNNQNQWIQVDFGHPRRVTGVLLQGRIDCCDQWVTSYRLSFSNDLTVFYSTPTIEGTYDRDTVTRRYLDKPFVARYVRLIPIEWNTHICLRFDLLGCEA